MRFIKILIYPNRYNEYIVKLYDKFIIPNSFGTYRGCIKFDENSKIIKTNSLENALIISRYIMEHNS